jgi:hypothetical protein
VGADFRNAAGKIRISPFSPCMFGRTNPWSIE